jgi:hypothetical protein
MVTISASEMPIMANTFVSFRPILTVALVLTVQSCGYDVPTAAIDNPSGAPRISWMTARADGESWNPTFVKARRSDGYLILDGTAWVGDEATLVIRLAMKAVVGESPQLIDSSGSISANVIYDPVYQAQQSWTAFGAMGSGTFVISSLSATRATGTFDVRF